MASIYDVVAARDTVTIKGLEFEVSPLTERQLLRLAQRFPDAVRLQDLDFSGAIDDLSADDIDKAADLMAAMVAAMLGNEGGIEKSEAHVAVAFSMSEMSQVIMKANQLTGVTVDEGFTTPSAGNGSRSKGVAKASPRAPVRHRR